MEQRILFPPEVKVGDTEGFTNQNDIFERKDYGTGLINLMTVSSDPLVIALDEQFGNGKTTFLKMLAGELREKNHPVIFFDAFEHDYVDDPFLALAGVILSELDNLKPSKKKKEEFKKKLFHLGKAIGGASLKAGVKVATIGVLHGTVNDDIAAAFADASGEATDKAIKTVLEEQSKHQDIILAFRNALEELPMLVNDGKGDKPLIIIIDELDRCKPLFALQLLERIKHFFSVTNVHFLLGVNLDQLRNSVNMAYGNIDANIYLQKFINVTTHFPVSTYYDPKTANDKYIDHLNNAMGVSQENRDIVDTYSMTLKIWAKDTNASLRTIGQIYSTLAMAFAFSGSAKYKMAPILAGLTIMKIVQPDLYKKAKNNSLTLEEALEFLHLYDGVSSEKDYIVKFWKYCLTPDLTEEDLDNLGIRIPFQVHIEQDRIIPYHIENIIEALQLPTASS